MKGLPPLLREAPHPLEAWPRRIAVVPTREDVLARPAPPHRPKYRTLDGRLSGWVAMGLLRREQAADEDGTPLWVDPLAAWRSDAVCSSVDPPKGTCLTCPVRWRCLEWALNAEEPTGRWGGLSTMARQRLLAAHDGDPVEALIAVWQAEHPETSAA